MHAYRTNRLAPYAQAQARVDGYVGDLECARKRAHVSSALGRQGPKGRKPLETKGFLGNLTTPIGLLLSWYSPVGDPPPVPGGASSHPI